MLLRSCVYLRHTIYPCAALLALMALLSATDRIWLCMLQKTALHSLGSPKLAHSRRNGISALLSERAWITPKGSGRRTGPIICTSGDCLIIIFITNLGPYINSIRAFLRQAQTLREVVLRARRYLFLPSCNTTILLSWKINVSPHLVLNCFR